MKERTTRQDGKDRLPPGQYLTEKWPVLHAGSIPRFDPGQWDFKIWGLVEEPVRLTYQEFVGLPKTILRSDIHCVTAWSKLDVNFEGVPAKAVLALAKPKPDAKFVMVHAEQGYEANLPLEYLLAVDALLPYLAVGRYVLPLHVWPPLLLWPLLFFLSVAKC